MSPAERRLPGGCIFIVLSVQICCFPHTTIALQSLGDHFTVTGGAAQQVRSGVAQQRQPRQPPRDVLVCNAYVHEAPLGIVKASATRQNLTLGEPLSFKECRHFPASLSDGEFLEFKVGRLNIGTFSTDNLPEASAKLLVIPTRNGSASLEAKFATHAFAELDSPQVVLMDTYQGPERLGQVAIAHKDAGDQEEELHFDSAIAMHPGQYQIYLYDADSQRIGSSEVKLDPRSQSVVLRVGGHIDADGTSSFPQQLLVFPPPPRGPDGTPGRIWSALAAAAGLQ